MSRIKRFKNRLEYLRWRYHQNLKENRKKKADYAREWRRQNPQKARQQDEKKRKKYIEERKKYSKKYARQYKRNPIAYAARYILNNAVRLGKIQKPLNCSRCAMIIKLHAHHHDYTKPLEVVWLCTKCHGKEHHPY